MGDCTRTEDAESATTAAAAAVGQKRWSCGDSGRDKGRYGDGRSRMGQSNGGGGGGARQHSRESGGGSRGNWGEWEWDRKGGGVISRKNGSEEANVSVCAKCCSRGTTCAADTCGDRNECGDGDPKANTRATGWCDSNVLRRERREMQRNNLALHSRWRWWGRDGESGEVGEGGGR
jgi:hypothetical protein